MFFGVLLAGVIGLVAGADEQLVLPLLATQILWINLLTDAAPALAVSVDPADPDVMRRPPRKLGEPIIHRPMWESILIVGAVMAAVTLLTLDLALPGGLLGGNGLAVDPGPDGAPDLALAQTMAFCTLVFCQLFNVFNARSQTRSAFFQPFSNPMIWLAVALSAALQVVVVYMPILQEAFNTTPLAITHWAICIGMASFVLWVEEIVKFIRRQKAKRPATPQPPAPR
jgi:magnesium-transporting ATPase (P-type)